MHLAKIDISLFMVLFWIMNQTKKNSVLHILNGQLRIEEEEKPTHKNMQISGKSIEKEITGKNEVEWKKKFYEWMNGQSTLVLSEKFIWLSKMNEWQGEHEIK